MGTREASPSSSSSPIIAIVDGSRATARFSTTRYSRPAPRASVASSASARRRPSHSSFRRWGSRQSGTEKHPTWPPVARPPTAAVSPMTCRYHASAASRSTASGASSMFAEYATRPVNVEWSSRPWPATAARSSPAADSRRCGGADRSTRSRLCCTSRSPSRSRTSGAQSSGRGQRLTAKQVLMPSCRRIGQGACRTTPAAASSRHAPKRSS